MTAELTIPITSLRIDVREGELLFRFFFDELDEEGLPDRDLEVLRVRMPKALNSEVAVYSGDDPNPMDETGWFFNLPAYTYPHEAGPGGLPVSRRPD